MDLNALLPILLNLLSKKEKTSPAQQAPEQTPQPRSDSYWQLPNYDCPNNLHQNGCGSSHTGENQYSNSTDTPNSGSFHTCTGENHSCSQPPPPKQQQNNYSQPDNNFSTAPPLDMETLIKIISQLSSFFPKKPERVEEEKKEVSPSYISKLPRTDRFTFE